jgi:hypothetical protein
VLVLIVTSMQLSLAFHSVFSMLRLRGFRSLLSAVVTAAEKIDPRLTLPNFSLLRLSAAPTKTAKKLGTPADQLLC